MALFSKIAELTLFSFFLLSQLQSSLLYKSGSAWSKMNVGLKTTNCIRLKLKFANLSRGYKSDFFACDGDAIF